MFRVKARSIQVMKAAGGDGGMEVIWSEQPFSQILSSTQVISGREISSHIHTFKQKK